MKRWLKFGVKCDDDGGMGNANRSLARTLASAVAGAFVLVGIAPVLSSPVIATASAAGPVAFGDAGTLQQQAPCQNVGISV